MHEPVSDISNLPDYCSLPVKRLPEAYICLANPTLPHPSLTTGPIVDTNQLIFLTSLSYYNLRQQVTISYAGAQPLKKGIWELAFEP